VKAWVVDDVTAMARSVVFFIITVMFLSTVFAVKKFCCLA